MLERKWKTYSRLLLFALCANGACDFSPQLITPGSNQRSSAPFNQTYPFTAGTDASYTFNANKIELVGGVSRLKLIDQLDDDNSASGFGGGTGYGAAWSGSALSLASAGSCDGSTTNCAELDPSWTPQWSHLISYWKMNNSWNDSKGTNHGSAVSGATFGAAKLGAAGGLFSGTNYVTIPHDPTLNPSTQITVMIWAYFTAGSFSSENGPIGKYGGSSSWLLDTVGGKPAFYVTGVGVASAATLIPMNTWVLLTGTYDGTTVKVYQDGNLLASGAGAGPITAGTQPVNIGAYNNGSWGWVGSLDDAAVFDKALTQPEIQLIYNRQSPKYSGTFTSRAINVGGSVSWSDLAWKSPLPFGKEIPASNEQATNYSGLVNSTGASGNSSLATGLVGLWHLDEPAGTTGAASVIDSSGQANHGAPTSVTFGTSGKLGNAPTFDGTSSVINIGTAASLQPTAAVTVSAWVKRSAATVNFSGIVSSVKDGSGQGGYVLAGTGSNAIRFYIWKGSWAYAESNSPLPIDSWHLVTGVSDGVNVTLYIDGVAQTATAAGGAIVYTGTTSPAYIGDYAGSFWPGKIDEAAVWSRALHPNEIKQIYQRGVSRLKFQVRTCTAANCTDDPTGANWKGPDGSNQTYFSELNNNSAPLAMNGNVLAGLPDLVFSGFTAPPGANPVFQYRAILEADDSSLALAPSIQTVNVGPSHYDASNPTIESVAPVSATTLSTLSEIIGAGGCAAGVSYILSTDHTVWYYWNGVAWVVSNASSAQSSTAAAMLGHLSGFSIGAGKQLYWRAFLKGNGTQACELDSLTLTGTF